MLSAGNGWIGGRTDSFTTKNGQVLGTLSPLLLHYLNGAWSIFGS
jgi:hypothetical protein